MQTATIVSLRIKTGFSRRGFHYWREDPALLEVLYDFLPVGQDLQIGKKEPGFISVKFGVTPQVGAHNPLGYDELVYRVDSSGKKELVGYVRVSPSPADTDTESRESP